MNADMSADSAAKTYSFQTETKQVLDIVIHSLYSHRDIFIRELISNSVDALEKVRYEKLQNHDIADADLPLEIRISIDPDKKTITIADSGIGLTEGEMVENLGTIAHSGSQAYIEALKQAANQSDLQMIGQFGVGFYSAFMAADEVRVQSRSSQRDAQPVEWVSDGGGEYTIQPCGGLPRGTKVILKLRDDAHEFADENTIKQTIQRYSNFVPFPIYVGDEKVNTVQALWTRNKNEINESEYGEFYKFIANDVSEPLDRLHFSADAPLQVNALLFIPSSNFEKFGFGKSDMGVNLYCRKVLIQENSDAILPDWLRFVKGVVDSEDLPLNISRETMQDNALVSKLRSVLTKRVIKWLQETARKDPQKYRTFWDEFGLCIKEGIASDFDYREDLAELLRYESSTTPEGELTSLAAYVDRMPESQQAIYFASGQNRATVENSPYIEAFRANQYEVLYVYDTADEFILTSLGQYKEKNILSADQAELDLPKQEESAPEGESSAEPQEALSADEADQFSGWLYGKLQGRVGGVRASKRLVDSPAILVTSDRMMTTGMQQALKNVHGELNLGGQQLQLEFNPKHPIIKELAQRHQHNAEDPMLQTAIEHIFDTARIAAGLDVDQNEMVKRNYQFLERALKQ